MIHYLIVCRSLTYAQRTARVLERVGIGSHVMRTPKTISTEGCNYCVKIAERKLTDALKVLKKENMAPKQVYLQDRDGMFSEVHQ